MVTPVEAATEGVVFVLVEADSGISALRTEVTLVAPENFATLVKGRALKEEAGKVKIMKNA